MVAKLNGKASQGTTTAQDPAQGELSPHGRRRRRQRQVPRILSEQRLSPRPHLPALIKDQGQLQYRSVKMTPV